MKIPVIVGLFLLGLASAAAAGFPPWQFGMTKAQVASFKEYGPYKSFSNGDLETFNARFHGRKQNIQFFFIDGRLLRMGLYFNEGTDRDKAIAAFQQVYEIMQRDYGPVRIPEIGSSKKGEKAPLEVQAVAATANAYLFGDTHIIPIKQPKDMSVSGEVICSTINGEKTFGVALFLDSR